MISCAAPALGRSITEKVPNELRRQIATVGSNINQLARLANAGKLSGASTEQLNQLVAGLLQTLK
ncbi:MobC family plasmid mobilization relaxosome protein (plasmid) [Hymenobacter sp. NBH84]|nr:MobC family plasmid mobilization relaxosome protein [Hymenobacter sp. NBH84]